MPEQEGPDFQKLKDLLSGLDPEALRDLIPPSEGVITMMFTDIVDSTRINSSVGDDRYFEAQKIHNSLVRDCLKTFHGHEIKTIGDSFFASFANPREAVECAIQVQERLASSPVKIDAESLKVRIGIHTGIPRVDPDPAGRFDLEGRDVNKAARIESLARSGQVLISEETNTIVKPQASHDWGRWEMKGLGPQRVFEVLLQGRSPQMPAGRMWRDPVRFLTSFVGRRKEVDELIELVKRERLVTVHSMGGIEKTRLADEAARRASAQFEDGAAFVELAAVRNSEEALVSELVARFEIRTAGFETETEALLSALRSHEMLVILDNFEAVISGAPLLRKLLLECPSLRILTTSQQPTAIDAEQIYPLRPMPVAEATRSVTVDALRRLDALALFQERATHANPDWQLTQNNALTVAEILSLTEGIPLAIELAVARLRTLQLVEIKEGLAQRLDFLRRHPRGGDPRHDSMKASFEWSFGLLKREEKALFPALSVFSGGFFVRDVQEVCQFSHASQLIESLREASLVDSAESTGLVRCRMLQIVRDFAATKLKPTRRNRLKRGHAAHFLKVLKEADQQLERNEQAFARIDADYENILAGVETSRGLREHRALIDYSGGLRDYLSYRKRFAQRLTLAEQALGAAEELEDSVLVAGMQNNLGTAYGELPMGDQGENQTRAITYLESALRIFTEDDFPRDWAMTQSNLGNAYGDLPTGDREENLKRAIACYEAALRVRTERDSPREWAATQNNLGATYSELPIGDGENLKRAITCFEAALRVRTKRDFPLDWATTQNNLGSACTRLTTGDGGENLRRAILCYEAALSVYTEQNFPLYWAGTQTNLGAAYGRLPTGDHRENLIQAIACYEAALRVHTEQDSPLAWAKTQNNLGITYVDLATGDLGENIGRAIEYFEAAARGFVAAGTADEAKEATERAEALKKIVGV
jgi:predicted ATPase/class 3 adenylate cyclase